MSTLTKKITSNKINYDSDILISIPYTAHKYIRCGGKHIENILGRIRLAFVKCPKCTEYISVYKDEISGNGQTKIKKCLCGYRNSLILKNWS